MKAFVVAAIGIFVLGAAAVAAVALQGSGAPGVRVEPVASRAPEPPAPSAPVAQTIAPPPPPQPAAPAPVPADPPTASSGSPPVSHDPADGRLESTDPGERQDGMAAVRDQRRAKLMDWMNRRRQRQ